MIMIGSCSVALKCEDYCDGCSTTSIFCHVYDYTYLSDLVSVLPPYTQAFSLVADYHVYLGYANFEHLTELQILNITTSKDSNAELFIEGLYRQNVFAPLAKLQVLKLNAPWKFDDPLDDLFKPLMHLEELDLSQTRNIDITYLHRALYGLNNSKTLKTIKLSNIQGKGYKTYSTLNLTWFLETLQNCPIKHPHIANNSLREIYPGIIRYTPHLEYIDVSHNLLVIFVSDMPLHNFFMSPTFFQETLMHKRLQEIDFSYQSPTPEDQRRVFLDRIQELSITISYAENFVLIINDTLVDLPGDIHPETWWNCIISLLIGPCMFFNPYCNYTLDYLRRNHSQFCKVMLAVIHPSSRRFYQEMPCSARPTFDDIYQENCAYCTVYPTMGSSKHLKLNSHDLNVKQVNSNDLNLTNVNYFFPEHLNVPIYNVCFHRSSQLEYLDLSGNLGLFPDQQLTISGLINIKVLNVSNTGITSLFSNMLLSFPNLEVMDISRNKVAFYNETPMSLGANIQFLNFSLNLITFVPQNLFSNSLSLLKLDLSHNNIQNFDFNINELHSLENLNFGK